MDDQLYYVESPDGQVLGPMNMILIIEGIAEGAILESARICEVGAQEWVTLSDVTYTREEAAEAPSLADTDHDLEAPDAPWAAATNGADVDAEEEPLVEEWTPRSTEPAADSPEDADEFVIAGTPGTDTDDFMIGEAPAADTDAADTDEFAIAGMDDPGADDETLLEAAAIAQDTGEFEAPESLQDEGFDVPEPIPHEEPVSEAPDFAGEPPADDPFESEPATENEEAEAWSDEESGELAGAGAESGSGGRPKWLIPAALLLVPIVGGIYLMTSSKSDAPQAARTETATTAPSSPMDSAREALAAGRAKEAQAAFLMVLAEKPDNAAAHYGMGRAALLGKDAELAVTHLEKAWELRSDEPMWLTDLASALHEAGRSESALNRIGAYLDAVPNDMKWQQARLDWMLESGKKDEAAKLYRALADGNPKSAPEQYLAGVSIGEGSKAETYLRRSIELNPSHGDAHVALARVLAVGGNLDAARASLGRAFDLRPASPEEQSFLASLEKAKPAAKVQTPVKAAASSEPVVAAVTPKATPKPAAKTEPAKAKAEPAKAELAKAAPAKTAPAKTADPAAVQRADLAKRAELVRAALSESKFDRAEEILAKAQKELGAGKEAARNIALWEGIVAFESGEFDDALTKFKALDAAASYQATGWGAGAVPNWIARVHFARGDVRSAVAALDGVGPNDPNEYATARLWEGIALATLGMTDLANRTWERIPVDVGNRVGKPGSVAVMSAKYLLGSMSEKDYLNQVSPIAGYENDMHFVMAYAARQKQDTAGVKQHLELSVQASTGREFPYHLAQAEMNGGGILK